MFGKYNSVTRLMETGLSTPEAVRKANLAFSGYVVESAEADPIDYGVAATNLKQILDSMSTNQTLAIKNIAAAEALGIFGDEDDIVLLGHTHNMAQEVILSKVRAKRTKSRS